MVHGSASVDSYQPRFAPFDKLTATHLYPINGPSFALQPASHSTGEEVHVFANASAVHEEHPLHMGVFASVWPAWYFSACSSHIVVDWIVCLEPSNWDFFEAALKGITVPLYSLSDALLLPAVHVIGVNDVTSRAFYRHLLTSAQNCPLILVDRRVRCAIPEGLFGCTHSLVHSSCGGVSDATVRVQAYSPSKIFIEHLRTMSFPAYPFAPLISILDRKLAGARIPSWKVDRNPLDNRQVSKVYKSSAVHPLGLFPLSADLKVLVATPCVYPTSPWTQRALSPFELGHVFDIPLPYMTSLGSSALPALLHRLKSPLKPLTTFVQHTLYYAWPPVLASCVHDGLSESSAAPVNPDIASPSGRPLLRGLGSSDGDVVGIVEHVDANDVDDGLIDLGDTDHVIEHADADDVGVINVVEHVDADKIDAGGVHFRRKI